MPAPTLPKTSPLSPDVCMNGKLWWLLLPTTVGSPQKPQHMTAGRALFPLSIIPPKVAEIHSLFPHLQLLVLPCTRRTP